MWLTTLMGCVAMVGGQPEADPEAVFEATWGTVDRLYPLFDEKDADWAAEGEATRDLLSADMGEEALFDALADMLDVLEDGHLNLRAPFDISRHERWFLDAPEGYDAALVERSYLMGQERWVGPFRVALLDEGVGYLRYGSFSDDFSASQLDEALSVVADAERLVLDLRSNGGGSLDNARLLLTRFLPDERVIYHRQYREGEGLGEPQAYTLSPGGEGYEGEVVVLTDARSYSAASSFTAMMKAAGHWQVGLSTGGGSGVPVWRELPNGWQLRVPSSRLLDADQGPLEAGVSPELPVEPDPEAALQGVDVLLEAAMYAPRP